MMRKKIVLIFVGLVLFCGLIFLGSSRGVMPSLIEALKARQKQSKKNFETQVKVTEMLGTDCFSTAKTDDDRRICEQAEEALAEAANVRWRDCSADQMKFRCPFTLVENQVNAERVRLSLSAKSAQVVLMEIIDSENGLIGSVTKLSNSNLGAEEVLQGQMTALNNGHEIPLVKMQIKGADQAYQAIRRGDREGRAALYGLTVVRGTAVYTLLIKDAYDVLRVPNFEKILASVSLAN